METEIERERWEPHIWVEQENKWLSSGTGRDGASKYYMYAYLPEHPAARKNGTILLHRLIMENHLGRYLERTEIIDHKDGNAKNNNIDNLEIRTKTMVRLRCPNCGDKFIKERPFTYLQNRTRITFCNRTCRNVFFGKKENQKHDDESIGQLAKDSFIEEYRMGHK